MKGLDRVLRAPTPFGNCRLDKVDNNDLVSFLINPFMKTACFNNAVLQKYPIGFRLDKVIFLENFKLDQFAIIDYQTNKIYVDEGWFLYDCYDPDGSLVFIDDLRSMVSDLTCEFIKKMKLEKSKEIIDSDVYNSLYKKNYHNVFQAMVFSRILGEEFEIEKKDRIGILSKDFSEKISLKKLVDIVIVDLSYLKRFAENLVLSNKFIEREYVLERLQEEANEYYLKGAFVKREEAFKHFVERISTSGAKKFTGFIEDGTIYHFDNRVTSTGKLMAVGKDLVFDFQLLERVEANGKVIYKRI